MTSRKKRKRYRRRTEANASGASPGGATIQNARDLALFNRLVRRDDWEIPEHVRQTVPQEMADLVTGATREGVRVSAARTLILMKKQNREHLPEFMPTQTPSASPQPEAQPSNVIESHVVEPETEAEDELQIGFIDEPNEAEKARMLYELDQCGALANLIGQGEKQASEHAKNVTEEGA